MKKLFLAIIFSVTGILASAQQTYEKQMEVKVKALENTSDPAELSIIKDDFVTIYSSNEKQWLPAYYAALSSLKEGKSLYNSGKTEGLSGYSKTAAKYLSILTKAQQNNAEVIILNGLINTFDAKITGNKNLLSVARELMTKAETLDRENPRLALLKAEVAYLDGKTAQGNELKAAAAKKFKAAKPKSAIAPSWGLPELENLGK